METGKEKESGPTVSQTSEQTHAHQDRQQPNEGAADHHRNLRDRKNVKVLLGICGSVAAVKAEALVESLGAQCNLKIVATDAGSRFLGQSLLQRSDLYVNEDDWKGFEKVGDPIAHIELRRWADILLLAPLSANTLAKMAQGLCDNLLTCVVRAWDTSKIVIVAPAMNTMMWESPFTQRHLQALNGIFDMRIIQPVEKRLACGDVGIGAMAPVDQIVAEVLDEIDKFLKKHPESLR